MNTTHPSVQAGKGPSPGRFFRLTYSNVRPDDDPKLFQCRDGMAFCELTPVLTKLGYEYGTTIYLYPGDERKLSDFPALQPSDILVLPTRPPLHDQVGLVPPRKVIHGAKTELEAALFKELSLWFEFCTRKHVLLTKQSAERLRGDDARKWVHIEFYEYSGGLIQKHFVGPESMRPKANHESTIGFFLRANNVPDLNCDIIASFGMDGYGTLIWNRLIRTRFPEWLASPGFAMAEIIFKKPIPDKPITPEFADNPELVDLRLLT